MTVHFTCPSCGHNSPLRLEASARHPDRKDVAWQTVSCTKCKVIFNVVWTRDTRLEEKIFAEDKRLDEEIQRLRDVP
jgi:C4-type Zn-finger protein